MVSCLLQSFKLGLLMCSGVARYLFWGGIKVFGEVWNFNTPVPCSITIMKSLLPHKKFTWTDFWRQYIPDIPRCRYAPADAWVLSSCGTTAYWVRCRKYGSKQILHSNKMVDSQMFECRVHHQYESFVCKVVCIECLNVLVSYLQPSRVVLFCLQ